MKKTGIWRGMAALTTFLLSVSVIVGNTLESFSSTIDTALGTQSEMMVTDDKDAVYDKFTPPAEFLNEDGTGNSHALIQAAIDLNRKQAAEGTVLLKNNGVLPLKSGSAVTLFGIRSQIPILGSSFGVKACGPFINLDEALSHNITDFANHITTSLSQNWATGEVERGYTTDGWSGDEFEFDGAGFIVNPVMTSIYTKLNETYLHTENAGPSEEYDPGEPSIKEIEGVNASYKDSFTKYKDAAIVVIGRPSAESEDYLPGGIVAGLGAEEPLALTANERDAIALAKECSEKVIVLVNSASAVEIGELKNDEEIDAILWIGAPGNYGLLGVADILSGKVSPSGGLVDIFATYNMSAPAMQNMGNYSYKNADSVITRENSANYIIEAEGIYVGYRYYETRYYDAVLGQGNATGKAGAYASDSGWDYDAEVAYGFGYGLSYTDFEMEYEGNPVIEVTKNGDVTTATATFNVKVTNTGNVAGKKNVQIYGQAPYEQGGVEKSAIQLLNYAKTDLLQPGESETVSVEVDLQYIATYDSSFDNGDGTYGTYILDPGTYYFAFGNGAHDALNNIMAAQGIDTSLLVGEANADYAYVTEITEDTISKTAFSVSKTGTKISNQLDYADWNYFQNGEVTYLSRADWNGTYPKSYTDMELTSQELIDYLNGKYYEIATDDNTSDIVWGQDGNLMFYEMAGVDFDDEKWETLLSEMTLEEAQYLATFGGPSIPGADSIGTVETYMTENAGNGIAVNLNASKDTEAPWNIGSDDPNGNWHPEVFGSSPLTAASFNPDLAKELGEFIGIESLFTGIPILWGPGLNTHRHAYNGRNGEYYSEDPILSGYTAMEFAIGALEYGLIAAPKHYAFNDQETNRSGVAPFMTEQRAREVELRAYQIAFEATKYDTEKEDAGMRGLMISFSKIGPVECTASKGLMTEILKKEWGFKGYAVTDIYDDFDLYGAVLTSGATCYDTRGMSGFYTDTTLDSPRFANQADGSAISANVFAGDANAQLAVRESAHNVLYAIASSNLMNRYNATTHVVKLNTWWRTAYYTAIGVTAALTVLFAVLYILSARKKEEI